MEAQPIDALNTEWKLLISGELRGAENGRTFERFSPYSRAVIAHVPDGSKGDAGEAVEAAHAARGLWRRTSMQDRAEALYRAADIIEQHGEELAFLDSIDAGSPIRNSRADIAIALGQIRLFAGLALEIKGTTIPASTGLHLTVREPVGVVVRIVPFNHPLMFACKVFGAILTGNPTILKPPELAPLSSLRLGELLQDVFPPGVLQIVVGDGAEVPDALVRHPKVRKIGFIGSEATGRAIQIAAAQSGIKDVSLELGGKNAMIVFEDADIEAAAQGAINGMNFTWSGQSCGSNSRLLVHRDIHDALVASILNKLAKHRIGNPLDPASDQGTMINEAQFDRVRMYIQVARDEGAEVLCGGGRPEGEEFARGLFISPTILTKVERHHTVANEEIFGPVLSVIAFDTDAEAIDIANDVRYGLTASVWTSNISRAHHAVREVEAGVTWINDSSRHYPNVPYGGMKASGLGREESIEELYGYTELKSINLPY